MRYTKILFTALATAAIAGTFAIGAFAGINPASAGLPTVTVTGYGGGPLANNQMSGMCVACHTRLVFGASTATHFVFDDTHATNSGGGWGSADYTKTGAVRNGGEYFHVTEWKAGSGIYSKYGNNTTKLSETAAPAGAVGFEMATGARTLAQLALDEIICESCHNIVKNEAGGNNLVAVPGDLKTPTGANAFTDSKVATLCVGCHGWLYETNAANDCNATALGGNYDNLWNMLGETGAVRKGGNAAEWKNDGLKHAVNHHVMSGDKRNTVIATAQVNWTPTSQFDGSTSHTIDTTVRTGSGYMLKTPWVSPFVRAATATNFSCLSCHSVGHGGPLSTGASILRGTASGYATTTAIDRLSDGSRTWKDQDANIAAGAATWCQNCHAN